VKNNPPNQESKSGPNLFLASLRALAKNGDFIRGMNVQMIEA
jgi:hypothetical protein